jgi:hypothetical protein
MKGRLPLQQGGFLHDPATPLIDKDTEMLLNGTCHCRAMRFSVRSRHPVPYQLCYCSICRQTQGGGGFAINISADAATLKLEGREHGRIYHAHMRSAHHKDRISTAERHFCGLCGAALWLFSPEWPELMHPFASAIETALPLPPARTHLMLTYKADWVVPDIRRGDLTFDEYPEESIAEWHQRHGVDVPL